MVCLEAIPFS